MLGKILPILKAVFIFILFIIFVFFFGYQYVADYIKDENLVTLQYKTTEESVLAPSITVCSSYKNSPTQTGWKNLTKKGLFGIFEELCGGGAEANLDECIASNTISLEKRILGIKMDEGSSEINPKELFDSELNLFGQCDMIKDNTFLGRKILAPGPILFLNKSYTHAIFIHDQKFRFLSGNPEVVPGFRFLVNEPTEIQVTFNIIEHVKRNTVRNPCNVDAKYSFTKCVKESLAKKVGCGPMLANISELERCNSLSEYNEFEKLYRTVDMMNSRDISKALGCKLPCRYREFEKVEEFVSIQTDRLAVMFSLATNDILVKTEVQLYKMTSLVGDIGGSLGLFLGFSFLTVWDWILLLFKCK